MGHQVNFYVLPDEDIELERAIRGPDKVTFLQDRTSQPVPTELASIQGDPADNGLFRLYVAREEQLGFVKMRFIEEQGHWLIESSASNVIEFDRCVFDGRSLRRGRLYVASDSHFRRNLPDADFVRWADRMMRRVRKLLVRASEVKSFGWFGRATLAAVKAGAINVSEF